jgi:hypothetical protein
MEKRNIESKAENVAANLNTRKQDNKIRRLISKIREDISSENKTDPSKERKRRTLTNHELGNVEFGFNSSDQEDRYFKIQKA